MSTNGNQDDLLRNPSVDYDRSDLSARGILLFLAGLLVAGIFIELVIWGMFRFLSHSTLFAQGNPSPVVEVQRAMPEKAPGASLQNTGPVNTGVFPAPRLQTNDAADLKKFVGQEQEILHPAQPFEDSRGAIHISIDRAMALIAERGLPLRPSAPAGTQMQAANSKYTNKQPQTPEQWPSRSAQGAKPGPNQ